MKIYRFLLTLVFALLTVTVSAQTIEVNGKVTDEKGNPMPGVGVVDKSDASNGAVTDLDGQYKIRIKKDGFLEFSFMSYKTVLEEVGGRKTINVKMEPSSEELEKVVVIGYGTSRKGDLTGSVSVVDAEDLKNAPVTSVSQALQGRVAGAEFMSGSGEPGEAGTILIRGSRSISAGNQPLIVVDGIVDAVSDLSEINPEDIVSISVLKDVSSTAIYGSRGANGVILITTDNTSKSSGSKFKVTLKATAGVSRIAGKLDIMDAEEYATWRNMVSYQNAGRPDPAEWTAPFDASSYGKGTDWVEELSRTGVYQTYHINLTGGNNDTRYSASFGYHNNQGVVRGSGFERYSGLMWLDGKLSKKLRWGIRISYVQHDVERTSAAISGTNTNAAIYLSPILGVKDTWNSYGDAESFGGSVFNNPAMLADHVSHDVVKRNTNIAPWLRLQINKYLYLKTKFSFTYSHDFTGYYSPSYLPIAQANRTGGTASRADWSQQKYLSETTLNYNRTRRGHTIEGLLGFTAEKEVTDNATYKGTGYLDDDLKYYNMAALMDTGNLSANTYNRIRTKMSVIGRANWSYRRRYYATLTMRADGASNFAKGNKWGFFPAAAFRWSIVNEDFLRDAYWLNDLSLRLSAGRSGNDAVGSYMSLATLTAAASGWMFGDNRELVYVPSKLENTNLTWETTDSYNVGLNVAVLKNRINLEADAYYSTTDDLLLSMRNSQTTGYNTYFTNVGRTNNMGVELTLTTKNVMARNFKWNTIITVAHNRQRVVDVGNDGEIVPTYLNPRNSTQYMYGYKNGYPVNALWGYRYGGVWHDEAELERNELTHTYVSQIKSGSNGSNVGRTKYVDVNHDGVLDQDDMVYLGSADPIVHGGFQNDFTIFRNLSVSVFFAYSFGGKIYNLSELWMASGIGSFNKYRYMLDAWDPDLRPDSDITKPGYNDTVASDFMVHDASYIRLKNVSVSYKFAFRKKSPVRDLTVGLSAENLFLWKKYNGFDPDVSTSSTVYRLDNGSLPRSRTVVFNVSMTF